VNGASKMDFVINNATVERENITFRQMGFGQAVRGRTLFDYELRLTADELESLIQKQFDEFVAETKVDDQETAFEDAIPELFDHDYPAFAQLIAVSALDLCMVICRYLFFELLEGIVGENEPGMCDYSINSVEQIEPLEDGFSVRGSAYFVRG
jgi:hypothetical protein